MKTKSSSDVVKLDEFILNLEKTEHPWWQIVLFEEGMQVLSFQSGVSIKKKTELV